MISEVSAVNFRQNLGEMLNQVQYRNDSIVISKDGKTMTITNKGTGADGKPTSFAVIWDKIADSSANAGAPPAPGSK